MNPLERSSSTVASWALALLSAGVTAAQVALMQVLSCMQWHHFAYLVVSVALLGFGASGTVLSLARERLLARADRVVPWLMTATGAGLAVAVALLQADLLRFDLYLLFVDNAQWLRLAGACALLAAPFFCAGLATGLMLTAGVQRAGRLYFANMAGSGVGSLLGLLLLDGFEPMRLPAVTAVVPIAAGLLLQGVQRNRPGMLAGVVLLLTAAAAARWAPGLRMSAFKDLARTLDLPEARVVVSEPSPQGWLQIVAAPALRGGPPAGLSFVGEVPRQQAVFLDGNRYGSLLAEAADEAAVARFDAGPESLPWRLGERRRVLLLHEAAAGEAVYARAQGAQEIVVAEPHRELARLLAERWRDDPAIIVWTVEPRTALARTEGDHGFDLIRLPAAGSFGGGAGLRAVAEEFLLTREAIAQAWQALSDDGVILVTAWMDHPERAPLRLLATLRAGLEAAGVEDARAHLVAVRGWASITFLVRRAPLDAAAAAAVRAFCDEHGFDPLILPGIQDAERRLHHAWDNPRFFALVDVILEHGDDAAPAREYPFRLDAPTDSRPYFSQFLRPASLRMLLDAAGARSVPFLELGSIIVAVTLVILAVLATVCILLPLARRAGWGRGSLAWTLIYFAALGAGFMLVEIVAMLRLTPFVGGAVPAAAVVLTTLLFAAGVGSHVSQRFSPERRNIIRITLAIMVGVSVLGLVATRLPFAWGAGLVVCGAVAALMIAPVGFIMGMAFPTGLRFLAARAPAQLPWAWAINSCLSVVTPSVAMLVALGAGYPAVFALAAGAYLIAALATGLCRS